MRHTVTAVAPGRVNVVGEHTDYHGGLALPFAIAAGVTVRAEALDRGQVEVLARDLGERDAFALAAIGPADGWRAYVRGVAAELRADGHALRGARLEIAGDVPRGAGLSSSAALEAAVALALLGLAGTPNPDRLALARTLSRAERRWTGAETGLLDQLASLAATTGHALRIDFAALDATPSASASSVAAAMRPVPLRLGGWTLATVDSGAAHTLAAGSGYAARRAEGRAACALLGVASLRDAPADAADRLAALPAAVVAAALPRADAGSPDGRTLARRVRHVQRENARVDAAVAALEAGDIASLGPVLSASHASLRDDYAASVPAVEAAVARCLAAGAAGARMVGGGFGGHVLALFAPDVRPPADARAVTPGPGARLLPG